MELDIIEECLYQNRFYFIDKDFDVYKKANWVHLPYSPEVSYKKFNDSKYYEAITNPQLSLLYTFVDELKHNKNFDFIYIIDLRAERKNSDILANTTEVIVKWIPIYDDWRPKQSGFFTDILSTVNEILLLQNRGGLF